MTLRRAPIIISLLTAISLCGCEANDEPIGNSPRRKAQEPSAGDDASAIIDRVQSLLDQSGKTIEDASSASQEELQKLGRFEYKIVTIPVSAGDAALEHEMNSLGREGWDCASIDQGNQTAPTNRFLCKRRPYTPLRYLPQTLLGR